MCTEHLIPSIKWMRCSEDLKWLDCLPASTLCVFISWMGLFWKVLQLLAKSLDGEGAALHCCYVSSLLVSGHFEGFFPLTRVKHDFLGYLLERTMCGALLPGSLAWGLTFRRTYWISHLKLDPTNYTHSCEQLAPLCVMMRSFNYLPQRQIRGFIKVHISGGVAVHLKSSFSRWFIQLHRPQILRILLFWVWSIQPP